MGFALDAARKLASFIDIKSSQTPLATDRIQAVARIRVAEPALLLNLDARQLNAMSGDERRRLIDSWEKRRRDGALQMLEAEEKLDLVREGDQWRIFLNWAAGVRLSLRVVLSSASLWEASMPTSDIAVHPGELFEIPLRVKNRSSQPVVTRIRHLIEPSDMADFLDFVECGFLQPVTLQPGIDQEFASRYLLRGNLPEGVRKLNLTYEFRRLLK